MPTRREFLQQAAILSSAAAWPGAFPTAIAKALTIDPEPGSTYLDAEHVVILMQENRSFDHAFGTLKGVRGFNDPRAITLPNGNPVWVQTNRRGESYAPFRLNIKDSNATWLGSLPHGRTDQVDARNGGRYDRWLDVKRLGDGHADMPFTLGHYTREDIPFYYALADAFTICDQHFCSALTCTTPNRLFLWSGTVREKQTADSPAKLNNEEAVYEAEVSWPTFPERLENHGISWKVYQNEIWLASGLEGEYDAWLTNFGDNPLEYFTQYNVRFAEQHRRHINWQLRNLPSQIKALQQKLASKETAAADEDPLEKQLADKIAALKQAEYERPRFTAENYEKLSAREKSIHAKALSTNAADPNYRQLVTHSYNDGGKQRHVYMPKGDVFHSFREDVRTGQLPTVSWLVAPERFSDHPGSAWYGAWYIAEAMNILTSNPDVWKKTVFILTYDENDGYFDHVPPFVAPHPRRPETGLVSAGINTSVDYVDQEEELRLKRGRWSRESSIGLGYRVPMIIASPWSRGGCVCSQVFDHTSVLQFLERLLTHKTGRKVEESNISQWRRTVCGDLTSSFQPYDGPESGLPPVADRSVVIEGIHRAKFKSAPAGFKALTQEEIDQLRRDPQSSPLMTRQEPGIRRSSPLPYELFVEGNLNNDRTRFGIRLEARNQQFGERAAGSPFVIYARTGRGNVEVRDYAVAAGTRLEDSWALGDFENGVYHLRVYGPNGFYREFIGTADDPPIAVRLAYDRKAPSAAALSGDVTFDVANRDAQEPCSIEFHDNAYRTADIHRSVEPSTEVMVEIDTKPGLGWYDLSVRIDGKEPFRRRYAGRVETGLWSHSDPAMGRVVGQVTAPRQANNNK
jgi:phospholipase C